MNNEKKLSERFAEALRNSDMVRMDNETNTAIISLRISPGETDEVLAVLRAAEAKEDALAMAAEALERAEETIREFVSDIEDGGSIRFAKTYVDRHRSARDCARSALAAIKTAMEGKA